MSGKIFPDAGPPRGPAVEVVVDQNAKRVLFIVFHFRNGSTIYVSAPKVFEIRIHSSLYQRDSDFRV